MARNENTSGSLASPGEGRFSDAAVACLLLRLTIGVNMAMHGAVRIFGQPGAFLAYLQKTFEGSAMPAWVLPPFAAVVPWVELVIGVLLLLGLALRPALVAAGLLMSVLTFGVSLVQKWDVAGLQLTYAVVFFLLLFARRHDRLSLDGLLRARRDKGRE